MVGYYNNQGVPTTVDLENHNKQKKYNINGKPNGLLISKPLCALMTIGAILLAVLVGLLVFFLIPKCDGSSSPLALTKVPSDSNSDDFYDILDDDTFKINNNDIDERLPNNIQPTHYRLKIMPFFNNSTTIGNLTITLLIEKETDSIILNVKDLNIDKDSVRVYLIKNDTPLPIKDQIYLKGERYQILMESPLETNIVHTLDLKFTGSLDSQLQGFYLSEYKSRGELKKIASTQFSPTDARKAFPCFDEPAFKSEFSISIGRPANMTTLSNMKVEKTEPFFDNYLWDHYETTPNMSTYLVAFFVGSFRHYIATDNAIEIKFWTKNEYIYATAYASEITPKILHYFEKYFGIPYKLNKMDIVAIPDFGFNAMENWGLITFRESALLYDPQQSDIDSKRDITIILAHELAHQWFGNLVTPKWWNDLWLKEGFATYMEYLATDHADPSWKINDEFIISETTRAFALDSLESSRPISFDVKNSKQIRQVFDELSYAKGACVIRMMNHFLGDDAFKSGLRVFLEKYQYGNANSDDLFEVLTDEAHRLGVLDETITIKKIMNTWTKQAGFPIVTVINNNNGKLILSQKRFSIKNSNSNSTWWIPISMTTSNTPNFHNTTPKFWLTEPSATIDFNKTEWYLLNILQTGYYIVNYDEANWRILVEKIMDIPPTIRAQLISDSMDLAKANLLDYHIPLKMISRMAFKDKDIMFVPTWMALEKLQFLSDILHSTPAFGLFEEFHSIIFKETYNIVNSNRDYYNENYLLQRIRRLVLKWACRASQSECAINSQHMFREWLQNQKEIPPNLKSIVYCTAIREGTELEWEFVHRKYLESDSVSERKLLLDALGCTSKQWLLSSYLNMLLKNNSIIRAQDAARVFTAVADNVVASNLVLDFLRGHWNELLNHYGDGFNIISKMIKSLPKYMNTEYQLKELIRFRNQVKDNMGATKQAFDYAIEKAKSNVEWMKKNYESVEKWLQENKDYLNA